MTKAEAAKKKDIRVFGEGFGEGVFAKTSSPDALSGPLRSSDDLVRSYLDKAPKGTAAELAREAEISRGTLSKLMNGKYEGHGDRIIERLAQIIRDREAAEALASGKGQLSWLVVAPASRRLRLVTRAETVEAIREKSPDCRIYQVWRGPSGDIKVWEVAMTAMAHTELRRERVEDAMIDLLRNNAAYTQREIAERLSADPFLGKNYSPDAIYVTVGHVVRTFRRDFYRDPSTKKISLSAPMLKRIREEDAQAAERRRMRGSTASGRIGEILDERDVAAL